jgi:sulfur carrier protein
MTVNGEKFDLTVLNPDFTLTRLIGFFKLSPQRVAVELNGNVISRGVYADTKLADNDNIEIIHYVGGG